MKPGDPGMIMVGHAYGVPVVRALTALPGRKLQRAATLTYASLLCEIEPDSGAMLCSVIHLAERTGTSFNEMESVMLKFAELRIVVRDPRRTDDAWCINPHLAWAGSLQARACFAALVPPPAVDPEEDDSKPGATG